MSIEELREYFDIDSCVVILSALFEWTASDVVSWANQFSPDEIRNPWFGYDGYIDRLIVTIVPDEAEQKLTPPELKEVYDGIENAIVPVLRGDWKTERGLQLMRLRVETVLGWKGVMLR